MTSEKTKNSPKEKQKKPKYNLARTTLFMLRQAHETSYTVILFCVLSALLTAVINITNLFMAPTILKRVEQHAPLSALLVTMGAFLLATLLLNMAQSYLNSNVLFGRVDTRTLIVRKLAKKTACTSYSNRLLTQLIRLQETATDAVSSNDSATEAIWDTLKELLCALCCFMVYLVLFANIHPIMLAVVSVTAIANYLVTTYLYGWGYRHREEKAECVKGIRYTSGRVKDVTFGKELRIFGMSKWMEDVYQSGIALFDALGARRERVYLLGNLVNVVLTFLRNGIAYAYLIMITLQNGLPASEFLLLFNSVEGFTAQITGIMSQFAALRRQSLDLSTVMEYLYLPEPFTFGEGKPMPADSAPASLSLSHVTYRYPESDRELFHDLSLTIRPSEKLAVVGRNGSGKTTLVKLLCGFLDPSEGAVLYNGEDIRQYDRADYYRQFSAVYQTQSLLDVTLAENVAQTWHDIDYEKVSSCLAQAGLTEKLAELPDGLKTHIGKNVFEDGIYLSGGETQRLLLARALYKDAPVIVLDEPTAALDPLAENDIYLKYNELTNGRTSIYISHRLSSTRFCDRIIYLENGQILEEGTHEELMQKQGRYAELFEIQSHYYKEGKEAPENE